MNTEPDMARVRAALNRYAPKRIVVRKEPPPGTPIDAALRKPLKSHGTVCKSGFFHKNFLHGS